MKFDEVTFRINLQFAKRIDTRENESYTLECIMKLYTCSRCNNLLYFENNVCLKCGHVLGFNAEKLDLIPLIDLNNGVYSDITSQQSRYRLCANATYGTCNWLIPLENPATFCVACQLNRTIPPLTPQNFERWKRIEIAKHRLVYSLLKLNLPVRPKLAPDDRGLAFDFLTDVSPEERVITGHDNGVITLNIQEADEAERVRNKLDLGEKYRTLLGHFRHEIGHYYWEIKIKDQPLLEEFRELFGDERQDYSTSLQTYYSNGPSIDWSDYFISPYATAHPWEDWAESWSHYLHMMDTLETAYYFGLRVHPEKPSGTKNIETEIDRDPYTIRDFDQVFETWLPLTFAFNSLNRSMGHADFYPFVIPPAVVRKLRFIHEVCGVAMYISSPALTN